jgi:acyl dehydratase
MGILAHTARGIAAAARRPWLVGWLWLANSLLAGLAALPAAVMLLRDLPSAPEADALRNGLALGTAAEVLRDAPGTGTATQLAMLSALLLAALLGPFFAAGIVETLLANDGRSLTHRFGRGAGHFGPRYLRAGVTAGVGGAVGAGLFAAPWLAARNRLDDTAHGYTRWLLGLAAMAFAGVAIVVALRALDYARLEIARRDERRTIRQVWRGLVLVLRHPWRTLGVWICNILPVAIAAAVLFAPSRAFSGSRTWPAIFGLVAAQQLFSLTRAGLRVALWSAEHGVLEELSPLAKTPPAPPEPVDMPVAPQPSEGSPPMSLEVGQTASRTATFTTEHVELYAQISGDRNPLHFDPEWVAKTRFGRLLVQGGLTTGLLHALVAMDLPGPGTVFLSQNWKFTAPVFIGDTVTAEARVVSVHPQKPVVQLAVKAMRQDGETVLEGEAWCYTARPA